MTQKEEILTLLKGTSSQNPMTMGELMGKSGISHEPLRELLDELYARRAINRALVIADGIEREIFWPTGVTGSITYGRYVPPPMPTNDRKPKAAFFATKIEEKSMEKQMEQREQPKTKTQIMLELLAEKGSVISSKLCKSAKASGVKPFLANHMARGEVVFRDSPEGKIYSLAPGVTLEQLQANKGAPIPRREKEETKPVAPAETAVGKPEDAISRMHSLRRTSPKGPGQEFIGTCVQCGQEGLTLTDMEGCQNPIGITQGEAVVEAVAPSLSAPIAPVQPTAASRFRVAITSDQTIMLFGLTPELIELDQEQTKTLAGFVYEKSEMLCV